MKTRVIQSDPGPPEPPEDPPAAPPRRARHLAARMGRWSAAHWKTATFGWLVIIAIVFYVGNQMGTETIDEATSGPGESGRVRQGPRRRLHAAGRRDGARAEPERPHPRRPRLPGGGR